MSLAATAGVRRDHLDAWPGPVRIELERRAAMIAVADPVDALDLSDPSARQLIDELGRSSLGAVDQSDPATHEVIVSIGALTRFADLPRALHGIRRALAPGGRLHLVEPVTHPGWPGIVRASLGTTLPAVRGQHLGRDIPLALRATGFTITDLERFTMPTYQWPLRPFIHARVRVFAEVGA